MPLRDEYRTALVTGASSGLGAAFVEMLAAEGVEVWGTARETARVPAGTRRHALALELADVGSVDAAWAAAERESGGIDLLVNNAGTGVFGSSTAVSQDDWDRQLAVMLHGPARLARLALQAMRSRARGCIVNVTSLTVEFPLPYMSAYNAAKAGLSALSASLDLECADTPVRLLDFRPGDHRTAFHDTMPSCLEPDAPERIARARRRLDANVRTAPAPARAARDLRAALARRRRGVVRSGTLFQARVAPFLARFAPLRLSAWVQRRYFDLG